MSTTQQPKLGVFSIAFICLLTISAIILPVVIVNFNKMTIGPRIYQPSSVQPADTNSDLTSDSKNTKQNEIVGVWTGWYTANQGKVKLTLTINSDMTGKFDFSNMHGMSNSKSGSYTVLVTDYNGTYNVTGKEWINQPSLYYMLNLNGSIANGRFSGNTDSGGQFQLNKVNPPSSSIETEHTQKEDYTKRAEIAMTHAIDAWNAKLWENAYQYYKEAADYPTVNSSAYKERGANKFKEKAQTIIDNNNGECDAFAKQLLQYAYNLNPTTEIRNLLNKCN